MTHEGMSELEELMAAYDDVRRVEARDPESLEKLDRIKRELAEKIFELYGIEL